MQRRNSIAISAIKNISILMYSLIIAIAIIVSSAKAQNNINLVRSDDNFSHLKNDSLKKGFDQLKYISLGKNYISFGAELREQFQVFKNISFGDVPPNYPDNKTSQWNHRLMLHINFEVRNHLRLFVQLSNTMRFLNNNPVAPEIDENQLSLHQAFAEVKLKDWKFRLGRQELFYGTHRLITVREGPNTRKSFDGVVSKRKLKNGHVDFFVLSPTISRQFVFDDEHFKEGLIGIYGTQYFVDRKIGLDYYALNFQSRLRKYNYQQGFENRQTYGIRLFSNRKLINFDLEAAYQSGKFTKLGIRAYNVFADINVTVLPAKKGIVGLAANIASGDKSSTDNRLNTYNLLFAKPAYGLAVPIGSTNIVSVYPYIKINPVPKLNMLAQVFFLARNSSQDGTYSPGMLENRPKPEILFSTTKKSLGKFYILETNYQQTKNLSFSFDASFFKAGPYPKETGKGKDISYVSFKSTFRF